MKEGLLGDTLRGVQRGARSRRPALMLRAGLDLSRDRLDVCLLSGHGELVGEFRGALRSRWGPPLGPYQLTPAPSRTPQRRARGPGPPEKRTRCRASSSLTPGAPTWPNASCSRTSVVVHAGEAPLGVAYRSPTVWTSTSRLRVRLRAEQGEIPSRPDRSALRACRRRVCPRSTALLSRYTTENPGVARKLVIGCYRRSANLSQPPPGDRWKSGRPTARRPRRSRRRRRTSAGRPSAEGRAGRRRSRR